jgi:hypothetical protein
MESSLETAGASGIWGVLSGAKQRYWSKNHHKYLANVQKYFFITI